MRPICPVEKWRQRCLVCKGNEMKNVKPLTSRMANVAFLMLFPGFFFYHAALGIQAIPPVLGGYFSPVALMITPILLILYIGDLQKQKNIFTRIDCAFLAFLIYFVFVISVNSIFFNAYDELVTSHLVAVLHFIVVFIIFKFADFKSKKIWWIALMCWISMTLIIFYLSSDGFFYLREQEATTNLKYVATYQGFGRSYFVTFLILAPFIPRMPLRLVLYIFSVAALFVNGSRSEFAAAIVALALIEIVNAKHRLIVFCLAVAFGFLFTFYTADIVNLLPENRTLQLLDLSRSSSWEERNYVFSLALETIMKSPLLGDYGSYVDNVGAGLYAHNIFSAWVDLGFLGFAWLLLILIIPLCILAVDAFLLKSKEDFSECLLTFTLVSVTVFLLFTTKEFTFMLTGAALGRYAHYQFRKHSSERYFRVLAPTDFRKQSNAMPGQI